MEGRLACDILRFAFKEMLEGIERKMKSNFLSTWKSLKMRWARIC